MPVRSAPRIDPASLQERPDADTTLTRDFTFLTPMMGGGVEIKGTQKPCDPVTPIRVASIRGQLRFWWRACNPGKATTVADLRLQEAELWGSTAVPSAVTITVSRQPGQPRRVEPDRAVAYGAFPLKPEQGSNAPQGKLSDFGSSTFTLTIRCPHGQREAVEEAIQAWTTFGGLGGRTRRGFGAIQGEQTDPAELLKQLRDRPVIGGVPSLSEARLETSTRDWKNPHDAWFLALSTLQDFRQGLGSGRNPPAPGSRSPAGRSRWPEPDQIRRLFEQSAPGHEPVHPVEKFPRAAFGLPMIFHFSTKGDPPQKSITLKPRRHSRLASPLLIRPIRDGEKFRAMALVLQVIDADLEYELDVRGRSTHVLSRLTQQEARQIRPLNGEISPLHAFLRHFSAKTKQ